LAACVLAIWAVVIHLTQLSWLVFVLPIPLVLLWATWLRAPDWIAENTTWRARWKASSVAVVPALLLVLMPIVRVDQVPSVGPGFSTEEFLSEITPAALETG